MPTRTALVPLTILLFASACNTRSESQRSSGQDAAPSPCELAGGYCHVAYLNHGPGSPCPFPFLSPEKCADSNAECCASAPTITYCGSRTCGKGNTCDSNVVDYCSGVQTTANCGEYACLGDCSCENNEECNCPVCQPHVETGDCNPGSTLYVCVAPQYEVVAPPPDAGICESPETGYFCCTP